MTILLAENLVGKNPYIENLKRGYEQAGFQVVVGVENFLFSTFRPDIVHIQWPEAIYKWRFELPVKKDSIDLIRSRLMFYQSMEVPIIYTVHNLRPHEGSADYDEQIFGLILEYADIIVHHGNTSLKMIKENYTKSAEKRHIICPHGPYDATLSLGSDVRKWYKIPDEKKVFLNFGQLRENKGNKFARQVFIGWGEKDALLFTIGPKPFEGFSKIFGFVLNKAQMILDNYFSKRMRTFIRSVQSEEIPRIVGASDVVFLSHLDGLNSGVLALAISYGKPVVYPDIGNFKEQTRYWPWQISYDVNDKESAKTALNSAMEMLDSLPKDEILDNTEWLRENSWRVHVNGILKEIEALKMARLDTKERC